MQTLFRSLSRWMLLVMLTTVLAPGFGWEVAGGVAAAHAETVDHSSHDVHDHHAVPVQHAHAPDAACDGCAGHEAPCDDLQHHCCPGHVLSHFSAALHAAPSFLLPVSRFSAVDRSNRRFSSRVPEGLERPPRSAFA
ncbi:hypothetical protein [Azonexus sp.]|uniref:hypothetical protein n=1 Tax=Azonexus sp. TaxID=1872668 RepID=UPI0027B88845|nr:hypothetical protein [Azonexus sp.]